MPWEIEWYVCRADQSDVDSIIAGNKRAKVKKPVPNVGDEFWRVAKTIGPLFAENDHWAGWHISGDIQDVVAASLTPDTMALLERIIRADFNCAPHQMFMAAQEEAKKILALAKADPRKVEGP
jgi:hypothetical protein